MTYLDEFDACVEQIEQLAREHQEILLLRKLLSDLSTRIHLRIGKSMAREQRLEVREGTSYFLKCLIKPLKGYLSFFEDDFDEKILHC